MIETGLRDRLAAQVPSAAGRVHPHVLPQNTAYPALTYLLVSDPRTHTHEGPDGGVEARWRVNAWSPRYSEAIGAASEVRQALDGFVGDMGGVRVYSTRHAGARDLHDDNARVHFRQVEFIIQYVED